MNQPPSARKTALFLLVTPIIAVNAACGIRIHDLALQRVEIKEDYSRLNSVTYGLLSIDLWKSMIQDLVTNRIKDFDLNKEQEAILKQELTKILRAFLAEAGDIVQKPQNNLADNLKGRIAKSLIKKARENESALAQAVSDEIQKPANLKKLKEVALAQFNKYAALTHSNPEDTANFSRLLAKHNATSLQEFNADCEKDLAELDAKVDAYAFVLMGSALLFLLVWWAVRKQEDLHHVTFALSVAFALILLLTSLSIPMMEVDARLKSVDLTLIGEHLKFNDQVLYYRSKSLMQVVNVLMKSGKADTIVVGFLVLLFSILFPIAKLVSTEMFLLGGERVKRSKAIQFFAFKSGKWSMADVMVVAIFMTYVGFESLVNNQLENLDIKTSSLESITTNASSLQPGFILFTTFVFFSLALSEILKRIAAQKNTVSL